MKEEKNPLTFAPAMTGEEDHSHSRLTQTKIGLVGPLLTIHVREGLSLTAQIGLGLTERERKAVDWLEG